MTDSIDASAKSVREEGLDKFYTIPAYSKKCIDKVIDIYGITRWDLIVEPSAGNGSFFDQIPSENKIGIDIEPGDHPNIIKQDFFDYYPQPHQNNILVIGNPPFGRVCSSAIRFFNHASEWANVIAFIIPRTFRRISVQNKLDDAFHLIYDEEVPTTPCHFTPKMMVKCCFQIWEKKVIKRAHITLPTRHDHWDFLSFGPVDEDGQPTPPLNADFAIRAYGNKIGEVKTEHLDKLRPKSWHWIKSKIDIATLISNFAALDYSNSQNTARQNSMGRGELVKLYVDFIFSVPVIRWKTKNRKLKMNNLYHIYINMAENTDNNTSTGHTRNTTDKFYTRGDIVDMCMKEIKEVIPINSNTDLVVEPSAGNGAFICDIKKICKNNIFYDIIPEHTDILKQDYLTLNLDGMKNTFKDIRQIHVIGNPPFGRQSSTTIQFIHKSCEFADTISFILPKSFNKQSMMKHFPKHFHLIKSINLPTNSFTLGATDKIYDVPCVFQIWVKKINPRPDVIKTSPIGYKFVKKDDPFGVDISFRRVGVNAGTISQEIGDKSIQSHYFIKFDDPTNIANILGRLRRIDFTTIAGNTVGPKSISKGEIIIEFNKNI